MGIRNPVPKSKGNRKWSGDKIIYFFPQDSCILNICLKRCVCMGVGGNKSVNADNISDEEKCLNDLSLTMQ